MSKPEWEKIAERYCLEQAPHLERKGGGVREFIMRGIKTQNRHDLTPEQYWAAHDEAASLEREKEASERAETNRRNASGGRKKKWAVELAEQLVRRHDKFPDAWRAIGTDGMKTYLSTDDEGREVVNHSSNTDGDDSLTKSTFRNKYFFEAKNRLPKP